MNSDDIITAMPAKARDAWAEYEGTIGGLPRGRRAIATHAFAAAWEASIRSCAAFLAAVAAEGTVARPAPVQRPIPGAPARCNQPLATIPRDGRRIWIERRPSPRVKTLVRKARWQRWTDGYKWTVSGLERRLRDQDIIAWEPYDADRRPRRRTK